MIPRRIEEAVVQQVSLFVDGTVIRAHQHVTGVRHDDAAAEALGRSQGGFSTKVHLRVDGQGRPLTVVLTPGTSWLAGGS